MAHECWTPLETIRLAIRLVKAHPGLKGGLIEHKRGIAWGILGEFLSDGRLIECPEHTGRYTDGGDPHGQ